MENIREEILGLKRLLVGVLVTALLITLLPFENMGTFVAKAEDVITENMPETLLKHDLFLNATQVSIQDVWNEETSEITKTAEAALQEILGTGNFATIYPNGVIIQNNANRDLDFSGIDLMIPAGVVGIDLGGYSIVNVATISFDLKTTSSSTEYEYNFFVLGDNVNSTISFAESEAARTVWYVEPNQQVVLYGVDVVNADIIASTNYDYGSAFGYDGIYYALPDNFDEEIYHSFNWYAIYREGKGVFRYDNGALYVDKLYSEMVQGGITDGVYQLMLSESLAPSEMEETVYVDKTIYAKEVMEYIATEGKNCKIGCFGINTYENPKTALIADSSMYGVYSITDEVQNDESKHVMTLYEYTGWLETEKDETDNTSAYLYMGEYFFEGSGSEAESTFDEIIFVDGAIPEVLETEVSEGDNVISTEYPVTSIRLLEANRGTPKFIFDFTSIEESLQIYNYSKDEIIINDNTEQNTIWAKWSTGIISEDNPVEVEYPLEVENAVIEGVDSTVYDWQYFVKAGSTFTVIPDAGYTIYDIQYGACSKYENDMGSEYYYDDNCSNLVTTNCVKINSDGTVWVTVPTSKAAFFASSKEIDNISLFDSETSKDYVTIDKEPYNSQTEGDQVAWYTEAFSVNALEENEYTLVSEVEGEDGSGEKYYIKHIYEICDEAIESDEGWGPSVLHTEECINKTQEYYVIDRSMEKIEYTYVNYDTGDTEVLVEEKPASTFGEIKKLTYTYSMDYASPVIKDIVATDSKGDEITLNGVWYDGTGEEPTVETTWTNQPPIILEVVSDDADILEYSYTQDQEWISSNTTEIVEDGVYDLDIYTRDEFDATTGRTGGRWITSLGVDTIAPILNYTDANYASADVTKELASNSEYEGNLYVTVEEDGAGFASISLYKDNNGTWEACSDSLQNSSSATQYYIRPTKDDVTYKIIVEDLAGNIQTYEGITLNGYAQDIAVEVTNDTGVYNQELTVNVRITNTSTTNSVDNLTYVIRESDTVFTPISGEIITLAPGASHDITLNVPIGTDAGEYLSTLDIQYTSTGNILENTIEKVYSHEITAVLEQEEGEGTFYVNHYYYGQSFSYNATSTTHEAGVSALYFKDVADATAEFTTEEPTAEGTYIARAEFTGEKNYKDFTIEYEFTISRKQATEDMYSVPVTDEATGWYGDVVTITAAEGYTLSTEENGEYVSELDIEESVEKFSFYIKTEDGAITNAVELSDINIDTEAPVISVLGATTTELSSGGIYSENLHLDIQDAGVGEAAITLESDMGELLLADDDTYYILQTVEDMTYTIVGTDALGNTVTYENVVVKAYEKDIEVSVENTEGQYNTELGIKITIKNNGKDAINITTLELDSEVSDRAFISSLEPTTLAAGQTYAGYIYLPAGTTAGEYNGIVNIDYTTVIPNLEKGIDKSYTESISATIAKISGTGSITVDDFYYGEEFAYKAESATNGTNAVTLTFREAGNTTAEFTPAPPTEVGTYEVKAVFAATENYTEVIATDTFSITRMSVTADMYEIEPSTREDGWYADKIIINGLNGSLLCETEDGDFKESIEITKEVATYSFYIKTATGAITEQVVLSDIKLDQTAPVVFYTDATTSTSAELVAGGIQEGNLYLTVTDGGIGYESVSLYKKNADGTWIAYAEGLKNTDTAGVYYIVPEQEDATYKVVAADKLGHESTYEDVTVKGYTQDIQITVSGNDAVYGKENVVSIEIKNTGNVPLNKVSYQLLEAETQNAFDALSGTIDTIAAGKTVTLEVAIAEDTVVGKYNAVIDLSYTVDGGSQESTVAKTYSQEITATVAKAQGAGTLSVNNLYYGEAFVYNAVSATNGSDEVVLYFKEAGNETAEYTTDIPTEVGTYEVKAVFAATENYTEAEVTATFSITRMSVSEDMYSIPEADEVTGWYKEDVIITAGEGYSISATEDGVFGSTLTIRNSVDSYTFYVKTETGAITEAVVLGELKIDTTAPEIAENEGIYAVEKWWQSFLEMITFGVYEVESTQIVIKAHDNESGISNISYYISEQSISLADIERVAEWTKGTELTIKKENYEQFILYVKVENEAGLVRYLSTDGIKLGITEAPVDPTPPVENPPIEDNTSKITGGKVNLKKNTAYQLEEGSWNVAGDTTNYTGGIIFYVDEDGEYEFTQN